jgi:DNA repair protein RadD
MIHLRDYQRAAVDALYAWFRDHPAGNPLLVLPAGSGKSVIVATLVREILETWPGQRVLMLTHVKELIAQNAAKLRAVWPQAPLGIHSAGLRRRDTFEPVIFAGIQSVANKAMQLGRFDLVLIDEVHLVSHKGEGQCRQFLRAAQDINPALRIVCLTATPFRTGHGSILHGEQALFAEVAYEVRMLDLIAAGHLAPLISKRMAMELDVSAVRVRDGEYVAGDLQRAVDREDVTAAALEEVLQYGAERRRWLVFCAGVAHAEHVAEALRGRGMAAGCVTGKSRPGDRDRLIAQYRSGQLQALTNADVLTTGFDAPETDLLVGRGPVQDLPAVPDPQRHGGAPVPGLRVCVPLGGVAAPRSHCRHGGPAQHRGRRTDRNAPRHPLPVSPPPAAGQAARQPARGLLRRLLPRGHRVGVPGAPGLPARPSGPVVATTGPGGAHPCQRNGGPVQAAG